MSDGDMIDVVSQRLDRFESMVFAVSPPADPFSTVPQKRVIQTQDKIIRFMPAAEQLLH